MYRICFNATNRRYCRGVNRWPPKKSGVLLSASVWWKSGASKTEKPCAVRDSRFFPKFFYYNWLLIRVSRVRAPEGARKKCWLQIIVVGAFFFAIFCNILYDFNRRKQNAWLVCVLTKIRNSSMLSLIHQPDFLEPMWG